MKILKYLFILIFPLLVCGCEKDSELNPIKCDIKYKISSDSFEIGEHININDISIIPIVPSSGIDIQKVEFFLGNKNIGTCLYPPFELDYEIPDLPIGEHLLQIDVYLTANGYDNTSLWIKQNIEINKPQTTE